MQLRQVVGQPGAFEQDADGLLGQRAELNSIGQVAQRGERVVVLGGALEDER